MSELIRRVGSLPTAESFFARFPPFRHPERWLPGTLGPLNTDDKTFEHVLMYYPVVRRVGERVCSPRRLSWSEPLFSRRLSERRRAAGSVITFVSPEFLRGLFA